MRSTAVLTLAGVGGIARVMSYMNPQPAECGHCLLDVTIRPAQWRVCCADARHLGACGWPPYAAWKRLGLQGGKG